MRPYSRKMIIIDRKDAFCFFDHTALNYDGLTVELSPGVWRVTLIQKWKQVRVWMSDFVHAVGIINVDSVFAHWARVIHLGKGFESLI